MNKKCRAKHMYTTIKTKISIKIGLLKHSFWVMASTWLKKMHEMFTFSIPCRMLYIWIVTALLTAKFQMSYQSSQIHFAFTVVSLWHHWLLQYKLENSFIPRDKNLRALIRKWAGLAVGPPSPTDVLGTHCPRIPPSCKKMWWNTIMHEQ